VSETPKTQVVIVGAGPVGLALAIELGHRGIGCLVIERNDRVGYAPRAKTTHARTREHLRRWGIAGKLREASPFGVDYPSTVLFVTRLGGHALAHFDNAFNCKPGRDPRYSEHAQWIPQYTLEEVLRAHAQTLPGVQLRFGTEFVSCAQDEREVRVQMRGVASGAIETVACDYLLGADGAHSAVREAIGARMSGQHGLSRNYNLVFRARGLAQAHRHEKAIMYWQVNPDFPGLIGPMDRDDIWFFMPTGVKGDVKPSDLDGAALIRTATGIDQPYEVLSWDEWTASRLIADRYRDRRVFLAGDACHLHPPFGGYGMNMGIADSVDLGWKIAAVLQGWGGPALLDSYERERRPVHGWVMDEAVANHAVLGNQLWQDGLEAPGAEGDSLRATVGAKIQAIKQREFNTIGVVLGYRYDDSPVIIPDGSEPPPNGSVYVPSARPGHVAPHAWLENGLSLYDCFGPGFTLLATREAEASGIEDAQRAASEAGLPLTVMSTDDADIAALYQARYALIRPDQHVAWRGDAAPARAVFERIAGRSQ